MYFKYNIYYILDTYKTKPNKIGYKTNFKNINIIIEVIIFA